MTSGVYVTLHRRDPRRPPRRWGVPLPAVFPRIRGGGHSVEGDGVPWLPPGWMLGEHGPMRSAHRVPARLPRRPTYPQSTGIGPGR